MSLKDFPIFSSSNHIVQRNRTICAILVESFMGTISVTLSLIWTGGKGGDVIYRKSLHTTNTDQRPITKAHLRVLNAQMS